MNEGIRALLEKIAGSEELQAKFAALASPEEAWELAKTLQEGFTKEEFLEAARMIAEAENGDISDEDLAATAGGTDGDLPPEDIPEAPKIKRESITRPNKTECSLTPLSRTVASQKSALV